LGFYSDGAKGGRPPCDRVAMFKILILARKIVLPMRGWSI
jgi:hypothetical protein